MPSLTAGQRAVLTEFVQKRINQAHQQAIRDNKLEELVMEPWIWMIEQGYLGATQAGLDAAQTFINNRKKAEKQAVAQQFKDALDADAELKIEFDALNGA